MIICRFRDCGCRFFQELGQACRSPYRCPQQRLQLDKVEPAAVINLEAAAAAEPTGGQTK